MANNWSHKFTDSYGSGTEHTIDYLVLKKDVPAGFAPYAGGTGLNDLRKYIDYNEVTQVWDFGTATNFHAAPWVGNYVHLFSKSNPNGELHIQAGQFVSNWYTYTDDNTGEVISLNPGMSSINSDINKFCGLLIEPSSTHGNVIRVALILWSANNRYETYWLPVSPYWNHIFGASDYDFGEDSQPGGGSGSFDDDSDDIDFPGLPSISALDTGLIRMYNPTSSELSQLSKYLWTTDFVTNIVKILNDPMESIISLSMVPVQPTKGALKTVVRVGNLNAVVESETPGEYEQIASYPITNQYLTVNCGTINLGEYWGSALDYGPYTKLDIFVPFSGVHSINIDDVMDGSIELQYNIDILTGAFVATAKCSKSSKFELDSVLYHWSGVMSVPLPLTASNYAQKLSSTISALTTVSTSVATGSPSAMATGVVGGVMNMMNAKPHINKSGNSGMIAGALDNQTPYLILTRPIQSKPAEYQKYKGWTANYSTTLGAISGYTEVSYVHVEGITATDAEKTEIENLLKEGVLL